MMKTCALLSLATIVLSLFVAANGQTQSPKPQSANLFAEGYALLKAGDAQAAADKFEDGLKSSPQNPVAHFFLGKAYFSLKKYEPAKAHLTKSLEIDPTTKFAPDAQTLLQQIAAIYAAVNAELSFWKSAAASNTESYYNAYLSSYPAGKHATDAKDALAKIAGDRVREALEAEEKAWRNASSSGRAAVRAYLKQYPESAHLSEAHTLLAWQPVVDPATKMMWTPENNGYNVDWPGADSFCRTVQTGGFRDWRLPTREEFLTIDQKKGDGLLDQINRPHDSGDSGCKYWTAAKEGSQKSTLYLGYGYHFGMKTKYSSINGDVCGFRALCVRGPDR